MHSINIVIERRFKLNAKYYRCFFMLFFTVQQHEFAAVRLKKPQLNPFKVFQFGNQFE